MINFIAFNLFIIGLIFLFNGIDSIVTIIKRSDDEDDSDNGGIFYKGNVYIDKLISIIMFIAILFPFVNIVTLIFFVYTLIDNIRNKDKNDDLDE